MLTNASRGWPAAASVLGRCIDSPTNREAIFTGDELRPTGGVSLLERALHSEEAANPVTRRVCIGHSHMACVLVAAQETGEKVPAIILKAAFRGHFTGLNTTKVVLDGAHEGLSPGTEKILER